MEINSVFLLLVNRIYIHYFVNHQVVTMNRYTSLGTTTSLLSFDKQVEGEIPRGERRGQWAS